MPSQDMLENTEEESDGSRVPVGRVIVQLGRSGSDGDGESAQYEMRIERFFSSGLSILERLLSLRGRLHRLSNVQDELNGVVNDVVFQHVLQLSLTQEQPSTIPPIKEADFENLELIEVSKFHLRQESNQSCPICRDPYEIGQTVTQLPCGHIYCPDCIKEWLSRNRSCPMCRTEVINVPKKTWVLKQCGFRQLRRTECFSTSAALIILSQCSHAFHRPCLRRHLRIRMMEPVEVFRVVCPLCKIESNVERSDLCAPAAPSAKQDPQTCSRPLLIDSQPLELVSASTKSICGSIAAKYVFKNIYLLYVLCYYEHRKGVNKIKQSHQTQY